MNDEVVYEGNRVRVVDANTEIHAIYYSVELKNGIVLNGFSGNTDGECEEAKRDGFTGKMAIHPAQIEIINEVFTPSPESIAKARAIVAAFEAEPQAGVIGFEGEMLDVPHLAKARRLLASVGEG